MNTLSIEVGGKLVEFEVSGTPKPHSYRIGRLRGAAAACATASVEEWRARVYTGASRAMVGGLPNSGAVVVGYSFGFSPRMKGTPAGTPHVCKVRRRANGGVGAKADPLMPDLDNLIKAAQDAIQAAAIENDVQVVGIVAIKATSDRPGARIVVFEAPAVIHLCG